MTQAEAAWADVDAIRIPAESLDPLDVLFDGRRVFSIQPRRHRAEPDGLREVPWPRAIRPYLHGTTEVTICQAGSTVSLFRGEVSFDDSNARVKFVDSDGQPLLVDKWGKAKRPFSAARAGFGKALAADLEVLLRLINEEFGRPAFLAYGTLLGAVRECDFIAHDDDADIAYLSPYDNPADVARESFVLGRWLRDRGWHVSRLSAGFLHVWPGDDDEGVRKIDVFTGYFRGEFFAIERSLRARVPRSAITPLSQARLAGVDLPAPGDPESVLVAMYGPSWREPDPAFTVPNPPEVKLRSEGWFGHFNAGRGRWEGAAQDAPPTLVDDPSSFAKWTKPHLPAGGLVVDVGCGLGVDAVWFAGQGYRVLGLDYSPKSLAHAQEAAAAADVDVELRHLALTDTRAAIVCGAQLARREPEPILYGRLLLDVLSPDARANLWWLAAAALHQGGRLMLEFRTRTDAGGALQEPEFPMEVTLEPDAVTSEIESRGGYVERTELATDGGWQVSRLVAGWVENSEGQGPGDTQI